MVAEFFMSLLFSASKINFYERISKQKWRFSLIFI